MATNLAEFIGAAIGFKLIFGVSIIKGCSIDRYRDVFDSNVTARGQKPFEKVIGGLLLFVAIAVFLSAWYGSARQRYGYHGTTELGSRILSRRRT